MKSFVIVVSGLSGAGKTVTLRALEDSGFFCVDNLPPSLIDDFIKISTSSSEVDRIAIGMDIRERKLLDNVENFSRKMKKKHNLQIIYLESEDNDLIRRYKETRRPHPLSQQCGGDILKAIEMEKELLSPLRSEADRILDTSSYTPHQLRTFIISTFGNISAETLKVTLISFGFKYSIPQNIDMLLDVRFLPNPHFVPDLKQMTGLDEPVKRYIFNNKISKEYIKKTVDLLDFLIPAYIKEGKTYLTIGVGCTGGRHRSPAVLEKIRDSLTKHNLPIELIHREI